ncbi:MAG: heme A synthase, partial [Pseudomonas sp.]
SNVLLHLPLAVAVAHNGGGAALLLTLVLINYRLRAVAPSRVAEDSRATLASAGLAQAGK